MLVGSKIVFASYSFSSSFAGRIVDTEATEVQELEDLGYQCPVVGSSITIKPIGSPFFTPKSFFIPSYVTSKTHTTPTDGQLILGKYSGQMTIECTLQTEAGVDVKTVTLNTITLFGTSRF